MTAPTGDAGPLLEIDGLSVEFATDDGPLHAVDDLTLTVGDHEVVGVVGESGSGKTVTALAILGLLPKRATVRGSIRFRGDELVGRTERDLQTIRGQEIAMIFQDALAALNPVMTVGHQIAETHRCHFQSNAKAARAAALEMLAAVHIRDPERVYALYPHQVSGGMGQRVMIAMMLIAGPDLLIADEPTSALDVTVQHQVLAIMDDLVRGRGMGLILISHNLHLVSAFCDRVLVMYAGRVVESCIASELAGARHPYTRGLLASLPELGPRRTELPQLQRDPAWAAP